MPEWMQQLLLDFFQSRREFVAVEEYAATYVKLNLIEGMALELNYLPKPALLLLSLRLPQTLQEALLAPVLQINHYSQQRALAPTVHLFDHYLVLRTCVAQALLEVANLDTVYRQLMQTRQCLWELDYHGR